MDFTREPIIETIITPKEGCKLVVRSSKGAGQEEFIADAVEVVSFGRSTFYRPLERPKAFLVPVSDYEVLEVREARMVLKNAGMDRTIKIGGGREPAPKGHRAPEKEALQPKIEATSHTTPEGEEEPMEGRPPVEKKKDRRRQYRKRRGSQEGEKEEGATETPANVEGDSSHESNPDFAAVPTPAPSFSSLLEPPPALISETISRYRENSMFKSAFFLTEEEQYKPHDKVSELLNEDEAGFAGQLQEPVFAESEVHEEPLAETQQGFEHESTIEPEHVDHPFTHEESPVEHSPVEESVVAEEPVPEENKE